MSLKNEVASIGYVLMSNCIDCFGKKHKYRTSPDGSGIGGGGATLYFADANSVSEWVSKVKQVREWQSEIISLT